MVNHLFSKIRKVMPWLYLTLGLNLILSSSVLAYEANPAISSDLWNQSNVIQLQDNTPTFILLTNNNEAQLAEVKSFIKSSDGRIVHTFPQQALIARVSTTAVSQLATLPGVAAVLTQAIELSSLDVYGPQARGYAAVWNNLIAPQAPLDIGLMSQEQPNPEPEHAFIAPDLPAPGDDQLSLAADASVTPGYFQTSEYLAGSVAVGVILVESNGTVDPSTENWTADEKQLVFNEIVAGLNWWADLEPRANLSFVYDDHFSNPLPTGVEPIARSYSHQQYWIADAMNGLGYQATSYFAAVRNYNNALRQSYQTDWAFTIFVVDSSADVDNRFSDGYFAYAYLGGPFMVMTSGNNGYGPNNMDAVAAHEMGHIFYALDQYHGSYQICTHRSGYLNIENQNSQHGTCASNVSSIMRGQTHPYTAKALDPYAAGQVGWRDSDGDDIFDPLDTALPIRIDSISQDDAAITVRGSTEVTPYPSPGKTNTTINKLSQVQYRLNGGDWQQATAGDGTFDGVTESYYFTLLPSPGLYNLEVAAIDSAGNISEVYATETITVLDPIDGGLNTELMIPDENLSSQSTFLNGVAYHLQGGVIAKVEYRIDGGPWQTAPAQDGAFDSSYEPFVIALDALQDGVHLIEAFATDANGVAEINRAAQEIKIGERQTFSLFLPIALSHK